MAPSHPLPSRKRGETVLLNQIGLHQSRGLAISHPHRRAQRDMSSPPTPKSTVAPPGRELAGTSQGWGVLMLLVLAAGTSSSPHWHAAEDTMGLLVLAGQRTHKIWHLVAMGSSFQKSGCSMHLLMVVVKVSYLML